MINITILGSTGSIGISTLQVLDLHPQRYKVIALTGNNNIERLFEQCVRYHPTYAVLLNPDAAKILKQKLQAVAPKIEVKSGVEALEFVASLPEVDYVMAAIVGAAGLRPTFAAVRAGKRILLANKETLVMAGALFVEEVKRYGATLLPVDSEHNALFQCLPHPQTNNPTIKRLILTASGGAFRKLPLAALRDVTPEQACTHPNWNMGRKVTVDSATMMNKGLEVIEAHWLFNMPASQIDVMIHPQSIVHSLVEYVDGSVLAQLGNPDMRTPIANALAWPDRIDAGVKSLDLLAIGSLTFEPMSFERYPCLKLAYEALKMGGVATVVLNAANEVAVQMFLEDKLNFADIPHMVEAVLSKVDCHQTPDLPTILSADAKAREAAALCVKAVSWRASSHID